LDLFKASVLSGSCPTVKPAGDFKMGAMFGHWQTAAYLPFFGHKAGDNCVTIDYQKGSRQGNNVYFKMAMTSPDKTIEKFGYYNIGQGGRIRTSKKSSAAAKSGREQIFFYQNRKRKVAYVWGCADFQAADVPIVYILSQKKLSKGAAEREVRNAKTVLARQMVGGNYLVDFMDEMYYPKGC